ncbi:ATP-binding protein [Iodobacter fluviatilis]|nr:ATP-binding protein [Iodobacter fluviatilis]
MANFGKIRRLFLDTPLLDGSAPDRSVCYARRLLYAGACILSVASIGMMCFGIRMSFEHFLDERQQLFLIQRDLLKSDVDRYQALLRQLVQSYETIDLRQERVAIPARRYQQLLLQQNNVMITDREITVTPFSVLSTLTQSQDRASISMLLRLTQEMSRFPWVSIGESNSHISGFVYSVDKRFFAVTPPLPKSVFQNAKKVRVEIEIARQIARVEKEMSKYSENELRHKRSVIWVPLSRDPLTGELILHIAKPVFNNGKRMAVVVFTMPFMLFERYFQQSKHLSDFLVVAQDHYSLFGLDVTKEREANWARILRAAPDILEDANEHAQLSYRKRTFLITQQIAGPNWVAVYVFDWPMVVQYLRKELWISMAVLSALLCILWGFVIVLDSIVLASMQKKARAVYESEAFNRKVLGMAPVGLAVLDPLKHIILMQNEIASGLTGQQLGKGEHFYRVLLDEALFSAKESGGNQQIVLRKDITARSSDGGLIELVADLSWVRYQNQDVVLCALTDITERKRAEKLLEEASLLADEANKAKSVFLATMSHEIRTPLHGALGNIELLEGEVLSIAQRARLTTTRRAFDALLVLTNNILDLSKIEAQELKLELAHVRLGELMERCAQTFSPLIAKKGLNFHCLIDPSLFAVWEVDGHRISQIIMNLLSNAVKFTQKGAITLYGTVEERGLEGSWLKLSIADSGMGIPLDRQAAVFDLYAQANESITKRFGGSGLGLSLCRRLLALAGGSISLDSEEGEGSIFTIQLPSKKIADIAEVIRSNSTLFITEVLVVCKSPTWQSALLKQVIFQLPGIDIHAVINLGDISDLDPLGASNKILLLAHNESCLPSDCLPEQLQLFKQIIVVSFDGPLHPEIREGIIYVTSLSRAALEHALISCAYKQDIALPVFQQEGRVLNSRQEVRILIAEDDETNLLLLEHQLNALGYMNVDSVSDGQQAFNYCLQRNYDLVITDLYMPIMGGQALLKAMRQSGITTPLLVHTANAYDDWRAEGEDFAAILQKPLSITQLGQTLGRILHLSSPEMLDRVRGRLETLRDVELEKVFLASWELDQLSLKNAADTKDLQRFERCLHKVKGGLLVLDEKPALKACEALLQQLRFSESTQMNSLLSEFLSIMSNIVSHYKQGI